MSDLELAVTAAAAASCAAGGGLVPVVVGALPRARDLGPGDPGPDYPALARRRGLRCVGVLVGGLLGAALGLRIGADPVLPALCLLAVAGLVLALVDVHEHRLPDAVVGPTAVLLAVLLVLAAVGRHDGHPLARAGVGGAASAGLLLLAVLARPDGLGLGDVKLVGLLAGLSLGALAGLVLLGAGRATRRTAIPLGPGLLAGALLVVLLHGP